MSCEKLRAGLNIACGSFGNKYYQQVVLVNRSDVKNKLIIVSNTNIYDVYTCAHRLIFELNEPKVGGPPITGYRFTVGENSTSIFGSFNKSDKDNIPQYSHAINIVLAGVTEEIKCIIKQLDQGDYFAAVQYYDGTIEIYGFEYGLSSADYGYDPQNSGGGGVIKLQSLSDALEDEPPFIYGGNPEDFDNNFTDIVYNPNGDFNDDFNDDFNNQD